ncbi:uncharacterized protein LOC110817517 isoform X1 [Carica papaya]|uniref:uncharacterized protein LOC110817517 isoform X1 n=1 Tax=Carica papaya TaxID=3649 RepID=UPI000B8CB655|nr:uncharacterized protein LOC110817517 isoform X1 [Carica papaya]XP_021901793.1 uncharacterized protein LOC110817517 isoform X1 [Carica papaya]
MATSMDSASNSYGNSRTTDKVLSQISDGLWGIIRSEDGMKSEITETVQSVYNKLVNPGGNKEVESSTGVTTPIVKGTIDNSSIKASVGEVGLTISDNEPREPPGFTLSNNHHVNNNDKQHENEVQLPMPCDKGHEGQKEDSRHSANMLEADDADHSLPPGFSADVEQKQPSDGSDEDPEVPPGFG